MRKAKVAVGYGGGDAIEKGGAWHFTWMPKGYAPTEDSKTICVLHDFDDTSDKYGFSASERHLLVAAIAKAIEDYMTATPT